MTNVFTLNIQACKDEYKEHRSYRRYRFCLSSLCVKMMKFRDDLDVEELYVLARSLMEVNIYGED